MRLGQKTSKHHKVLGGEKDVCGMCLAPISFLDKSSSMAVQKADQRFPLRKFEFQKYGWKSRLALRFKLILLIFSAFSIPLVQKVKKAWKIIWIRIFFCQQLSEPAKWFHLTVAYNLGLRKQITHNSPSSPYVASLSPLSLAFLHYYKLFLFKTKLWTCTQRRSKHLFVVDVVVSFISVDA